MAAKIGKGTRVRVVSGQKSVGITGTVFWTGPDKYDEDNLRLGVRADDGETLWLSQSVVEEVSGKEAELPPAGPPPNKGDRVQWKNRGDTGEGTIFWVGQNKSGPGYRVGVRLDDQEDPLWLDARQIEVMDTPPRATGALPAPPQNHAPQGHAPQGGDDEPADMWSDGAEPAGNGFFDDDAPDLDESHSWSEDAEEG